MTAEKIATCCYCGTRAALVLTGKVRHELACSACGAPLHDLKQFPANRPTAREGPAGRSPAAAVPRRFPPAPGVASKTHKALRKAGKKSRKRKAVGRRLLSQAFDLIDDIFD